MWEWFSSLRRPRLIVYFLGLNVATQGGLLIVSVAGGPLSFQLVGAVVAGLVYLRLVLPWVTMPAVAAEDAWRPPRPRPGDNLVEARLVRSGGLVEFVIVVVHQDGRTEGVSGPLNVGPDDYLITMS